MRPRILMSCSTLLVLMACSTSASESPGPLTVLVQDNSYSPSAKTITVGQTVTWQWSGSNSHSVTFTSGPTSATQMSGSYTRTFSTAGTFNYTCLVHGSAMSGSITVTAAASGVTSSF